MNKKIEFEDNNEKYVLEYNRDTISILEQQGFSINELTTKPMTMLPLAFQGLFYKNHKYVKKSYVDECYKRFKNKEHLLEVISGMLLEAYETLTEDEEVGDKGNIDWKIVG
jgi:hypothetical protein